MFINLFNKDNGFIYQIYYEIFLYIIYAFVLGFIIIGISYLLAVQNPNTEKISAYECGFEPFEDARNEFNVNFYIVAILFIIFDVEVIFLFPWCLVMNYIGIWGIYGMITFLVILAIGFVYEIINGALNWP